MTSQAVPVGPAAAPSGTSITLEQLTAQLSAAMAPVAGGMTDLKKRISDMESEVTAKVGSTLELVRTLDQRQKALGQQMETMQLKIEDQINRGHAQDQQIRDVLKRLDALEADRQLGQPTAWRRLEHEGQEGDRGPAVIIGGWREDNDAEATKLAVQNFIREKQLPLPVDEVFVPGRQRGFAVVPLQVRESDVAGAMFRKAIEAVETTRRLQIKSGHKTKDGKDMVIWAAVSQPPEVRRKARLLAKTKRAILEGFESAGQLGDTDALQVRADYRRGAVLIDGVKVAGTTAVPTKEHVLECETGWVDAGTVCRRTREEIKAFSDRWRGLVDQIN